jgi:phage RecT family recombinase
MTRDDVSTLLRKSFPKFNRISATDEKHGLVVLQASKEASFAIQRIINDNRLLECWPDSVRDAYENCAMIGLSLNPALQYAAIIPTWIKDRQRYEAQLWPMYRGFIKLATDTGLILSVEVENVYAADSFKLIKRTNRTEIEHTIAHTVKRNTEENPYFGTYVITRLVNDPERPLVEWVPADDVEKAKLSSKNYDPAEPLKGVWGKWEDEMRRKVAIKRAQKYWPKTDGRAHERLAQAVQLDNTLEGAEPGREREKPLDVKPEPAQKKITKEQAEELTAMATAVRLKIDKVCAVYFIDKIEDLPAKLFNEVKNRIEAAGKVAAEKQKGNKPAKDEPPAREPGADDEPPPAQGGRW